MKHILIDSSPERHILDLRLLGFSDVQILGRYVYTNAKAPLEFHDHGEMMEICHLIDGQQFYRVEKEEFFLNGGDVLVNYPYERHGTGCRREGRGTLYWMIIKPPGSRSSFLGLPPLESQRLWTMLNPLPRRHFHVKPDAQKILDKVFALLEGQTSSAMQLKDVMFAINIKNYLLRYLLDLVEYAKAETIPSVSREIRLAVESIKQSGDQFHPMWVLARSAGLSESHFKHRFKEEIGISPADYQLRHKIDSACQMLQENKTIIDISYTLGFSSSQYFATVFRRYMGISPTEYRNSICIS